MTVIHMKTNPANLSDIPALERLINCAYRSKEGVQGWTNEGHLLEGDRTDPDHLKELVEAPNSQILLCYSSNDELIGSVHLIMNDDRLYFGMLAVDPLHQSKGVGRYLLQAAKELALTNGFHQIKLTVLSTRQELIDWYIRSGFTVVQENLPFPNTERFGKPKMPLLLVEMEWKSSSATGD
ncbi:MAG: hypothetical protein RIQ34_1593 [Bacteroidota bacterium]